MMRLCVVAIVLSLFVVTAHAEEQVRSTGVVDMKIRVLPPVTAATVSVKASDYTPRHGWLAGDSGRQQAIETMLMNGYDKLALWMKEGGRPAGPSFVIFDQDPASTAPNSLTCKIGYPVHPSAKARHIATIERLPSVTAAVIQWNGHLDDQPAMCDTLSRWISSRGYVPSGPIMEVYLNGERRNPSPASDMTEIRWPVRRVTSPPQMSEMSPHPGK